MKGGLSLSGEALIELMRAVLARGLPFRFAARGFSMAPFIRDGDVISVSPPLSARPVWETWWLSSIGKQDRSAYTGSYPA